MTEYDPINYEVHSKNKDLTYQKRLATKEELKKLLVYNRVDDLVDMLMQIDLEQD